MAPEREFFPEEQPRYEMVSWMYFTLEAIMTNCYILYIVMAGI